MAQDNFMGNSVNGVLWQDYRASNTGMAIFYGSDSISELPIREVPLSYPSEISPEPNYETGTFGYYSCSQTKIRTTFVKLRTRYLLFITKYVGTAKGDFKGKYFVTGYYRVTQTADVKRRHIRFCGDYSCLGEPTCYALRTDEMRFVSIKDAYPVTADVLKAWGFGSRLTRQSRILLTEEQAAVVLDHLRGKRDITGKYVEETTRLQPSVAANAAGDDDDDGDDDE